MIDSFEIDSRVGGKRLVPFLRVALAAVALLILEPPTFGQETLPALRDLGSPFFSIGVGVDVGVDERPDDAGLLASQFSIITPENCMKPVAIQNEEGVFRFELADRFMQFADDNELQVVGHCLVLANVGTPEWFFHEGDGDASSEVLLERMQTHIETAVGRYQGRIAMWDVVNEALADGDAEYLRDSDWSRIAGEEFIVRAFEAAHAADPDALLIYNDYNCEHDGKRQKLLRLVDMLQSRGAPLHVIGLQGHYELDAVPYEGLEQILLAARERGLKVVISELDIDVVPRSRWWAENGRYRDELSMHDPYRDGCPPEILERQAEQYARLFELLIKYEDVVERVTFWDLHDGQSWLNSFPWDRVNHPLLFDRDLQPKPAFDAVVEVLTAAGSPSPSTE
jgi:endo-1,4-beta-xylanase